MPECNSHGPTLLLLLLLFVCLFVCFSPRPDVVLFCFFTVPRRIGDLVSGSDSVDSDNVSLLQFQSLASGVLTESATNGESGLGTK